MDVFCTRKVRFKAGWDNCRLTKDLMYSFSALEQTSPQMVLVYAYNLEISIPTP